MSSSDIYITLFEFKTLEPLNFGEYKIDATKYIHMQIFLFCRRRERWKFIFRKEMFRNFDEINKRNLDAIRQFANARQSWSFSRVRQQ